MNKTKIKISLAALLGTIFLPVICLAQSTFNLGTLDLKLANHHDELVMVGNGDTQFSEDIIVTNRSDQTLDLSIYAADAALSGQNFLPTDENQGSADLATWIKLPTNKLELAGGTSETINVKINFPSNAGVGKHLGAIMFKYQNKDSEGNLINIEKGIRLRAQVTGQAVSKYQIINPQTEFTDRFITYSATLFNSGNTDLKGSIDLTNQNHAAPNEAQSSEIFLTPGESQEVNLAVEKPQFGQNTLLSTVSIGNHTKTFILNENFYLPGYLAPLFLILTLAGAGSLYLTAKKSGLSARPLLLLAIATFGVVVVSNFSSMRNFLKVDIFNEIPETGYLTTIKWGNFSPINKKNVPPELWNGTIKTSSGRLIIVEKLHDEKNDQMLLNTLGNVLTFKNSTGPDNDGVIVLFKPDIGDANPSLNYRNNFSGEEYNMAIPLTLNRAKYINYKGSQVEFKTTIAGQNVTLKDASGTNQISTTEIQTSPSGEVPIYEIESSPNNEIVIEGEATGDVIPVEETSPQLIGPNTQQLQEELAILREIIKDLPSSSDVLSQYILNSRFVELVTSENNSTTVIANSVLIDKLKNAPLTIQEMSSSADQNFIFVPNEKIELTPQQFSFDQNKSSSQILGEIVFVQNKNISWNTYLSISDFVAVSGKGSIPASHVTVTPGAIQLINQIGEKPILTAGTRHRVSGSGDLVSLVNVYPTGDGEAIFVMRPQISLNVPAGTPPGLYRANITIKEI